MWNGESISIDTEQWYWSILVCHNLGTLASAWLAPLIHRAFFTDWLLSSLSVIELVYLGLADWFAQLLLDREALLLLLPPVLGRLLFVGQSSTTQEFELGLDIFGQGMVVIPTTVTLGRASCRHALSVSTFLLFRWDASLGLCTLGMIVNITCCNHGGALILFFYLNW